MYSVIIFFFFFFFQAEDGIRDGHVTGVQTCALPICPPFVFYYQFIFGYVRCMYCNSASSGPICSVCIPCFPPLWKYLPSGTRSEERRVGKECGSRWGRVGWRW